MSGQVGRAATRGRGNRAGLDLGQIVATARELGGADLTMQAVSDRLGVDRKTINHYVRDRETLLRMAALAAVEEVSGGERIPEEATWQEAVRIYADVFVECLLRAGSFVAHLRMDADLAAALVDLTESLAERLDAAGFDEAEIVRILAQITNFAMTYVRDRHRAPLEEEPLRPELLRAGLAAHRSRSYPLLERILQAGVDTYDRAQFDLAVDTFIAGIQALRA